ncbi:MAG: nitroreductase family deazaflavin-dependent oxidoreductase [Deinococcus sp.]|nr:nitroreductase family deazaflavin-dependent oxidoreductase [Deinococcus sp.]
MTKESFVQALQKREDGEISITVKGRRSGRAITLPVWFVLEGTTLWLLPVKGGRTQWYQNLLADPTITIRTGRQRQTFQARAVNDPETVGAVVTQFRKKYTPGEIARYYTGLDVAVEVALEPGAE